MDAIDLILRGAAIGCSILVGLRVLIGPTPPRKAAALVAFIVLIGCYLLVSSPSLFHNLGQARPFLIVGATLGSLAFTWAILEILFDEITDKWPWLLIAFITVIVASLADQFPILKQVRGVMVLALYFGLLILAVVSGPDDLVEKRRTFRRWFVGAMALLGVIISGIELGFDDTALPRYIFPIQAATFFILSVVFGLWVFSLSPDVWPQINRRSASELAKTADKNKHLISKLMMSMDEEVWREEGLTIGLLAERLGVPEHKLRTTINQELEFRNFSTFINGYRINAAMQALDDPELMSRTILEIAYGVGFSSLGPFNKAFRYHTGKSPREYRGNVE